MTSWTSIPQEVLFNSALYGQASPLLSSEYIAREMSLINPNFQWRRVFDDVYNWKYSLPRVMESLSNNISVPEIATTASRFGGRDERQPRAPSAAPSSRLPETLRDSEIIDIIREMDPQLNLGVIFENERRLVPIRESLRDMAMYDEFTGLLIEGRLNGTIDHINSTERSVSMEYSGSVPEEHTGAAMASFPESDVTVSDRSLEIDFPVEYNLIPPGIWGIFPTDIGVKQSQRISAISTLLDMVLKGYRSNMHSLTGFR
uniref:Uncharacterized protein n=1 Tax=viral metagenome TaxID=1070528 RepID=A0A6C0BLG0_9ZZZZ